LLTKNIHFKGIQTTTNSGCYLTHKYLYPNTDVPEFIQLLDVYDCWKESSPDWARALRLQYGIKALPNNPVTTVWKQLLYNQKEILPRLILEFGILCKAFSDNEQKWYGDNYGYEAQFKDEKFKNISIYVMNTGFKGSINFGPKVDQYDAVVAYVQSVKGGKLVYTFSIYSTKIDVSEIATHFGGGGHPGASGFSLDCLPFEPLL
ncbi:MAG TPA: DHHA1 domain-containing protein, partial [Bacteroidales bacterium]|nr:DHHA1 domain-containing protein [Bacteroidales bacterium]